MYSSENFTEIFSDFICSISLSVKIVLNNSSSFPGLVFPLKTYIEFIEPFTSCFTLYMRLSKDGCSVFLGFICIVFDIYINMFYYF